MKNLNRRICGLLLTVAMVLSLCCPALAAGSAFPDTEGHWAEKIIQTLAEDGIINGCGDGKCHPDAPITRGQFATLVARALKLTPKVESAQLYTDIAGHWAFEIGGKTKIVCACKDFTADGKQLFDFCSIKNTILDSDSNGSGTELADVLDTIEKQQFVAPDVLLEHFWNVFVIDALLGNFDRHNGNWGFLHDPSTGESSIAPVFDCGSCLLPQADEKVMAAVRENEDMLNARVYQFPTSAIKLSGRKINYYDFLTTQENADCEAALKRIVPKVDMERIGSLIDGVPYITDLQKKFYKKYISARYELILQPAFELAMSEQPHLGEPTM